MSEGCEVIHRIRTTPCGPGFNETCAEFSVSRMMIVNADHNLFPIDHRRMQLQWNLHYRESEAGSLPRIAKCRNLADCEFRAGFHPLGGEQPPSVGWPHIAGSAVIRGKAGSHTAEICPPRAMASNPLIPRMRQHAASTARTEVFEHADE